MTSTIESFHGKRYVRSQTKIASSQSKSVNLSLLLIFRYRGSFASLAPNA